MSHTAQTTSRNVTITPVDTVVTPMSLADVQLVARVALGAAELII